MAVRDTLTTEDGLPILKKSDNTSTDEGLPIFKKKSSSSPLVSSDTLSKSSPPLSAEQRQKEVDYLNSPQANSGKPLSEHPFTTEPAKEVGQIEQYNHVVKLQDINQSLKDSPDLESAIYKFNKVKDPNLLSGTKKAQILDRTLNDPDFNNTISQNGKLIDDARSIKNNLVYTSPGYVAKQVEQKIGQHIQDSGKNSLIYENKSPEELDAIVDEMANSGKLSPQEKSFYLHNREVMRDAVKQQSPDLLHSTKRGLESGVGGVESSLRDIGNKATGGLLQKAGALETDEARTGRLQDEQATTPQIEAKSFGAKAVSGIGQFTGYVAPMILNSILTKGAGMSEQVAEIAPAVLQFEGGNADKSREISNDPKVQYLYTLLGTGFDATLGKVLPTGKIAKGITGVIKNDIAKAATEMTEDNAANEVIKKNLLTRISNIVGDVVKKNTETAGVVTAYDQLHKVMDAAFGQRDFQGEEDMKDALKTFGSAWLSSTGLSLGGAALGRVSPKIVGKNLVEKAENPEQTIQDVQDAAHESPAIEAQQHDIIKNVMDAHKAWGVIKELPLTEAQKEKFLVKEMQQKVLDKQAADAPIDVIKNEIQDKANEAYKEKLQIYNGTDQATEHENYAPKEEAAPKGILDRVVESVNGGKKTGLLEMLAPVMGTEREQEGVDFVKQQSIDAPNALSDQLSNNKELVTDLIAMNSPEDIQKRIDHFTEKLGEEMSEEDTKDVDKNLELLDEGLEKTKNKDHALQIGSAGGLLQHPQSSTGETRGERGGMESEQQGEETAGTRPEEKETGGEEVVESGEPKKIGVHHAALTNLAEELGLAKPEKLEYITPEEHAERGRKLMDAGASVDEIGNASNDLHDRISLGRAYLEKYYNELNSIRKSKGIKSEEYLNKKNEIEELSKKLKPLGSKAGQAMTSLQGERDIDTDNFEVAKRNLEEQQGKPLTESQSKRLQDLSDTNEKLRVRAEDAEAKLVEMTDRVMKAEEGGKKSVSEKAKSVANRLRKAKLHRPGSFSAATPASLVWDSAVEVVAKTIEAGGEIAEAIDAGIKHIKESDWYKSLSDEKQKEAANDFTSWHKDQLDPVKPTIESLWKRFANKEDNDFSKEESKALWDYAKDTYLKKNVPYVEMIKNVSDDTGLTWRQVQAAINPKHAEYKGKPLQTVSDEMWKNRSEYRKNQNATKRWTDEQVGNPIIKAWKKFSGVFRGSAVFGHGAIFVGTHSGMTLFDIPKVKYTLKAFLDGYKFAYGNKAKYEQAMEALKSSANYLRAQRAGLRNNPDVMNAEEYQKSQRYLGKLAGAGERGFNAIKLLRQSLFDYEYNKLSDREKKDVGSAKAIATLINNATGATTVKLPESINELTFAGGMEVSRWEKLTKNPLKAASTVIKVIRNPSSATTEEKVFAKVWATRVGTQLATMSATLILNAAIQSLIDDKNKVNFFDPSKPDWLKYKIGDLTIDPTSGMRGTTSFLYGLGKIPLQSKKDLHGDTPLQAMGKRTIGYGRGKLAPFYSTLADFYNSTDFKGNPLWYSKEKVTAGKHRVSWPEYITQKLPLPVAEAFTETFNSAKNNGGDDNLTHHIVDGIISGGLSGATGFRVGEFNTQESKHSPFTEEDNKIPSFKFFLDKGLELPNTALSSEKVKDKSTHTEKKISEYPKEVQEEYLQTHKDYLKESLDDIIKKGYVFVNPYGDVATHRNEEGKRKEIKDLTKEEMTKVLHIAQSEATTKAKKKVFKLK